MCTLREPYGRGAWCVCCAFFFFTPSLHELYVVPFYVSFSYVNFMCLPTLANPFFLPWLLNGRTLGEVTDAGAGASASFPCTSCPLVCRNPGALATHAVLCRRKWKLQEAAVAVAVQATEFLQRMRDHEGRKLWTTDHTDIWENCYGTGELLLYSYCNTARHLH